MPRDALRITAILAIIISAIVVPVISSGYSELSAAASSSSYIEIAEHYWKAAQRIPWRADAYEFAGHAYYHAKEYVQADTAYQKAFHRNALSAAGWVAWGDVQYLNDDPLRAREIW